jgi:hypothetical protein
MQPVDYGAEARSALIIKGATGLDTALCKVFSALQQKQITQAEVISKATALLGLDKKYNDQEVDSLTTKKIFYKSVDTGIRSYMNSQGHSKLLEVLTKNKNGDLFYKQYVLALADLIEGTYIIKASDESKMNNDSKG